ncbi:MAG: hypothetical protein RI924_1097 [Bacteroidota bacterium]
MLKYELIPQQMLHEGLIHPHNLFSPALLEDEIVFWTHEAEYYRRLKNLSLSPQEERRIGFPLSEQLVERELRIARGTVDGAHFALEHGIAFNVAGGTHHAGSNWGEGFCMLNDQAIAANYLLKNKLANAILIIDLDVHQGNGTAEIFATNDRVFTFSMHGEKNFPFRKEQSNLDIGLEDGTSDELYLKLLRQHLDTLFKNFKPDFVFYLSGVDILSTDKLGKLSVSKEACKLRDRMVLEACKQREIPVQVSMGGGYSPQIKDIVDSHCNTFRTARELYF